jgi:hypothetical protein
METNKVPSTKGSSRRAFLSASAVTAIAVPLATQAAPASAAAVGTDPFGTDPFGTDPANPFFLPDPDLVAVLSEISSANIQATLEQLIQFGTRHTASSQTDPARGIGAATAWVTKQMQAIAATSNGNMTFQQGSCPPNPRATTAAIRSPGNPWHTASLTRTTVMGSCPFQRSG